MSVARWDPLSDVSNLQRSISQLFDSVAASDRSSVASPASVYDMPDEAVVCADLPGVQPQDVQVQYHEGQLFIRATRRTPTPAAAVWLLRESGAGEYARAFRLAAPVDAESVEADLESGVLTVRLHKAESARPRQIPVRGAPPAAGNGSVP